jgi:tRNA (cytidine/uridine-2'-O-)-methyltransferase
MMRLALFQPDMPTNTGAAIRLCACLGVPLDIVEPCGFALDDTRLKRVAMDYDMRAEIARHRSWNAFREIPRGRLVLLTTRGDTPLHDFAFAADDVLVCGRESAGAPEHVHAAADARLRLPMASGVRSFNIVTAAALALGEALRQTGQFPSGAAPDTSTQ